MTKDQIRQDRGEVYGPPDENHSNIAAVWTALYRSRYGPNMPPITADLAELFLAGAKAVRIARPLPDSPDALKAYMDSFPDAHNYLDFAEEYLFGKSRLTDAGKKPI